MNTVLNRIAAIVTAMALVGCATTERGALLGGALGGAAGFAISSQDGHSSEQRATGLAIGALIGGTIGYFVSKEKIRQEQLKRTEPKQMEFAPKLKRPEVRRIWVPDQIVGDEYVAGHWKFVIEKNSVWTKEE